MSISVVLATFNEEKNLPRTLDSVKGFADEIVVVDGTSTDKTVEIAENYGAKVIVRENPKIFHINKQIAIDKATKDWTLQLDADEIIDDKLKNEIKEVIKDKNFNGYWLPRKNYFLGRFLMKGGQYPDYTLRLYRTGMGKLPQKDVHEQAEVPGNVGHLKNAMLHYPYENFSAYYKKWKRYNDIFADQISDEYKSKNFLLKLAGLLVYFLKGLYWFLLIYFRHKGIVDRAPGFIFAFFSGLRYPVSYFTFLFK